MSGRPVLLVNAVELLRQPGHRTHVVTTVPLDELDVDNDRLVGDVAVDLYLESTIDDVVVTGTLSVGWSDVCRRCLRSLGDTLGVAIAERYAEPSDGLRPVDPEAFPIVNGQIDLRSMVREEIMLAAPDAPLCAQDCPGLCAVCGADLRDGGCGCTTTERDERWAVLDQLRGPSSFPPPAR